MLEPQLVFSPNGAFARLLSKADDFAKSDWPVLILGESGVGKELLARRIHDQSQRARKPFLPVNCGALPANLFESEVFGHERGAFSGASQASRGLVRAAEGGTLFFDEVGDLDSEVQVKLLRLVDRGEVRSVGSARIDHVSVRVVAATNIDLYDAVQKKTFRWDLLARLGVLTLSVPPLRERKEDVQLIAQTWAAALGFELPEGAMADLLAYDWPGNIRQLRNLLIRASVLSTGEVTQALVQRLLAEEKATVRVPTRSVLLGTLADAEKEVILSTLKKWRGNRKAAAEELGIAKSTLHDKLRRWGVTQKSGVTL